MAYEVLARKWRPRRFSEVVGQEHITRTLQNAITQNRVGHAYLFVGPRGTGKTTTARIFAKALNCDTGMVPEPCCECPNCLEIASGASLDVNELDGASHNRVDHIRDIRQNVQYSPSRGRFKIYIIDEVHMLTPSAWNALLKTLEEPPAHVKFLFATTEPHKVLPTIVSRCQRFDLKAIPVPLIVERLRQIADQERIRVDDAALNAIARAADGGMRDAQSIFDQMIAFCGGLAEGNPISEQDVIDVFGLASGAELRTLAVGMFQSDLDEAIAVIQNLADHGRDLERVYADLLSYVRNIMVCSICRDPGSIVEVAATELQDCMAIAGAVDADMVQRILQGLVREEWSFRSALNKRLYLEAILARVMLDAHSVQLDDVIAQLAAFQKGGQTPDVPAPPRRQKPDIPPPPARPSAEAPARTPAGEPAEPESGKPSSQPVSAPEAPPRPKSPVTPVACTQAEPTENDTAQATGGQTPSEPAVTDNTVDSPGGEPPDLTTAAAATPEDDASGRSAVVQEPPTPERAQPDAPAAEQPSEKRGNEEQGVRPAVDTDQSNTPELPPAPDPGPAPEPVSDFEAAADTPAAATAESGQGHQSLFSAPAPWRLDDPQELFKALLEQLDGHPSGAGLVSLVKRLRPVSLIENVFQLAYEESEMSSTEISRLLEPQTGEVLQECFSPVAPDSDTVLVVKRWIPSVSAQSQASTRPATPAERDQIAQHPFVRRLCEQVNGSVVDARVIDNEAG